VSCPFVMSNPGRSKPPRRLCLGDPPWPRPGREAEPDATSIAAGLTDPDAPVPVPGMRPDTAPNDQQMSVANRAPDRWRHGLRQGTQHPSPLRASTSTPHKVQGFDVVWSLDRAWRLRKHPTPAAPASRQRGTRVLCPSASMTGGLQMRVSIRSSNAFALSRGALRLDLAPSASAR